ncbi:hypothetical protein D3C75_1357040 [compost metagenome]
MTLFKEIAHRGKPDGPVVGRDAVQRHIPVDRINEHTGFIQGAGKLENRRVVRADDDHGVDILLVGFLEE